jgi:hypothetical protein
LVVINTIWTIAFNSSYGWFAGVEGDDVVDQGLSGGTEREGFGRIGVPVFGGRGLADFELFARNGGHGGEAD